ncbi:hypothetical protein GWI33_011923 [Rhynchophorus ferrugineus]|uniref:Uncharacterized protein n=1 Tax=Rhynchophorus ferrugineus TaxID=354439 RepID=A0A834J1F1_RHYFE|nr:hypothetical protein GWI33_011923 [Rhynchophorus ferrugineus]
MDACRASYLLSGSPDRRSGYLEYTPEEKSRACPCVRESELGGGGARRGRGREKNEQPKAKGMKSFPPCSADQK